MIHIDYSDWLKLESNIKECNPFKLHKHVTVIIHAILLDKLHIAIWANALILNERTSVPRVDTRHYWFACLFWEHKWIICIAEFMGSEKNFRQTILVRFCLVWRKGNWVFLNNAVEVMDTSKSFLNWLCLEMQYKIRNSIQKTIGCCI